MSFLKLGIQGVSSKLGVTAKPIRVVALMLSMLLMLASASPALACVRCVDVKCESGFFAGSASCSVGPDWKTGPDGKPYLVHTCREAGNCVLWALTSIIDLDDIPTGGDKDQPVGSSSADGGIPGTWDCLEWAGESSTPETTESTDDACTDSIP